MQMFPNSVQSESILILGKFSPAEKASSWGKRMRMMRKGMRRMWKGEGLMQKGKRSRGSSWGKRMMRKEMILRGKEGKG